MHEKKFKGDVGLTYAIARLTELEWNVSIPISEHAAYDLIAEKDGKLKRIQVRYTTPTKGVLRVKLRSTWSDKNGTHVRNREKTDWDVLAVFNPETKKTCFLDANEFDNSTSIAIRIEPSKNNQTKGVRFAKDFLMLS